MSAAEISLNNQIAVVPQPALEAEALRGHQMFEHALFGYSLTDTNGIIHIANPALAQMLKIERRFLLGKPLVAYVVQGQTKVYFRQLFRLLRGQHLLHEWRLWLQPRLDLPFEASITTVANVNPEEKVASLSWLLQPSSEVECQRPEPSHETIVQHLQEAQRALGAQLLAAQEQERKRVSRELHDDLNQKLAMLAVEVEILEKELPASRVSIRSKLISVRDQIASLSEDVRTLAHELHPAILEHLGLVSALDSHVSGFAQRERIEVTFNCKDLPVAPSQDIASCLYRVTQEGLRNIAKHAQTKRAVVALRGSSDYVLLSIKDFGIGFDPNQGLAHRGLGLISMQERARLVNGSFFLTSKPGKGTRVTVRVPLAGETR